MIDPSIPTALSALNDAFTAAGPVSDAPPLVVTGLQTQTVAMLNALDAQVASVGQTLDGFAPADSAPANAAMLIALGEASDDETTLFQLRSLVGRVESNLNLGTP